MQTLTFTQKLLRQRRFLSFLFPLFAVFVGLGSSQSVLAQAVNTSQIFVDPNASGTNTAYGAKASPAPQFQAANLGSFEINAGQLILNGGRVTTTDGTDGTDNYAITSVTLQYAVYRFGTTAPTTFSNNIPLVQTSGPDGLGNRTFSLSNAQINLIRDGAVVIGGTAPGTQYNIKIQFVAAVTATFVSTGLPDPPNDGSITDARNATSGGYIANFKVTGVPIAPTNIGNSDVFINFTGATTPNTKYGASSGATPLFNGATLGDFDINNGKLTLNGGDATTFESDGDAVQSARLAYLIVKLPAPGQPGRALPQSFIALSQVGGTTAANGGFNRTFSNTTALRNLISGLANLGNGTYTISVTFEAVVLRANGGTYTVRDDNGGSGYTASFTTSGVPILIDTWTGGVSDDWFTPGNWDLNFVPTANTNVVIPDFGPGNAKPYPNINAGVVYIAQPSNTSINNTNSGPALSRDVVMQGTTQAQRSICRLIAGRWRVFGSFDNSFVSYIQRAGTVFELAGSGNQTITGGAFTATEISGGGTKNLTGIMTVSNSMTFLKTTPAGLFTTDISNPDNNYVDFAGRSTDAPDGAQLLGESETGYLRGFAQTTRSNVTANEVDAMGNPDPRTYANMGLTILFTGTNNPGDVLVTRNTAESYTPLVRNGAGVSTSRFGIRRIFGVRPGSPNTGNGGLAATLTFRYLDSELTNLGPGGTGSVPEPELALFVSTSGGNQFGFLGRDALDQVNNILTKSGVRTFATFTLGDRTNPLPVSLTGFDAKRIGADALVTWQTASEQNNKGFNVQVSADGKTYRTVGFVASETPNSTSPKAYTFTDTEKNKGGARYYRLEQLDVDGKSTFFAPRVVTFEGKATEANSGIVAYPNPLNSEILHLSLNSSVSGTGVVRVLDMTGRQVAQRNLAITIGSNDVAIENMSELKSGLYILNVMLPSGEKKTMKVVKQ